jgi:hypothetical protein
MGRKWISLAQFRMRLLGALQLSCGTHFLFHHKTLSAAYSTLLSSGVQPGAGPFDNEFTFHLGQTRHHAEEEAASVSSFWRGGRRSRPLSDLPHQAFLLS